MSKTESEKFWKIVPPIISIAIAMIIGFFILLYMKYEPFSAFAYMTFGTMSPDKIANILFNASPLILTGLSVAVAFRGGMFNIGTEGQMIFGAFLTSLVGFGLGKYFGIMLDPIIMIPLLIIVGLVGGALWALIPGILKAKRGVHEVISTIMMNYIASFLMLYMVGDLDSPFIDRDYGGGNAAPQTPVIAKSGWIDSIANTLDNTPLSSFVQLFKNSPLHWGFFIALTASMIVFIILWKTKLGYETRAVGFNQDAAKYSGINVSRNLIYVMMISGALGGLAGALEVMGFYYRYIDGFSSGYGFDGITVALLGGNHPFGVLFGAILLGWLTTAGQVLQVKQRIPKDVVNTLKGIIVFLVAVPLIARELIEYIKDKRITDRMKSGTNATIRVIKCKWKPMIAGFVIFITFFLAFIIIPLIAKPIQEFGNDFFSPFSEIFSQFELLLPIIEFLESIFSIKLYLTVILFSLALLSLYWGRKNTFNIGVQYITAFFTIIAGVNILIILISILGQELTIFGLISLILIFIGYQEFQAKHTNFDINNSSHEGIYRTEKNKQAIKTYIVFIVLYLILGLSMISMSSIESPMKINFYSFFEINNFGSIIFFLGTIFMFSCANYLSRKQFPKRQTITVRYVLMSVQIIFFFIGISILFGLKETLLFKQTLNFAIPIGFAALGGMYSEKSGVVNIGLEGMMLSGAFVSVWISYETANPWLGVFGAIIAGTLMGLLHAIASIRFRADQVVVGVAINLLASALTTLGLLIIWGRRGTSPKVGGLINIKLNFLSNIPFIGDTLYEFAGGSSGLPPLAYLFIFVIIISTWVIQRTSFGLRVRSVGEHPKAADTLGINVFKIRYICVTISGILAALGGAHLTLGTVPEFRRDQTSGRGFVALAALIFGAWNPIGAALATLLFGFAYAFRIQLDTQLALQNITWFLNLQKLTPTIPFILTLIIVSTVTGRSKPPAADGVPYEKES